MGFKKMDASVTNLEEKLAKFEAEAVNHKTNLILFLADVDPATSLSWCPDCVRAEPVIYRKLEEAGEGVSLLRAYVGDKATWRNPQHPWRVDPRFHLTAVPTLLLWHNHSVSARLDDHQAHLPDNISALLASSP
ncbi:hypothetical protein RND81_12G241600 [Saponaria officinalis]|uniref:Thioredoxin-like protein Clot n=1 Tax=Saponaria officinalis TaxID=3572 RepID=A0AAW1HEP2_SAPOF